MARPARASDSEILEAFERIRNGQSVALAAKDLHIRPATLRYHFQRLTGNKLRPTRRLPAALRIPEDPAVLAYMAGIIDGEGSICRNGCKGNKYPTFMVTFSNTNRDVVRFFANFGGWTNRRHDASFRKGSIKSCLPQFGWGVSRAVDVYNFLEAITPYLIIKKEKGLEAMDILRARLSSLYPGEYSGVE